MRKCSSLYEYALKASIVRQQSYSPSIYALERLRTEERQRELRARRTPRSLGSQVAIAKTGCERSRSIDAVAKIRENIGDNEFSDEAFEAFELSLVERPQME